ncbi:uncharacterized protein EURHEDRAFT_408803 [Aspergillus ruber CBS 135680]|uniref:Uncharacterized protein n=1 Tax=Aspergillus ruber (strain CBS 135680) TaxID=1388766 RepID=A0A017SNT3_ASPRC|nr:uncharacterized protein EURHEDRAFT_408803 [Aspergillus ruber CBS 135680]EYE98466.1 hypothetical protein EURHEDRAFT_408803 [Aspergillus ruber CBS 135680]
MTVWTCFPSLLSLPGPVLHLVFQTRHKEAVCILVKKFGVDPLVEDQIGKTTVDWTRYIDGAAICRKLDPTYRQCQII